MYNPKKLIILDEATANVDLKTDGTIQKLMKEKFKNCTVVIIAHRINTVMDCDRIMVIEDGRIKEFDTPYNLSKKEDSYFTEICEKYNS